MTVDRASIDAMANIMNMLNGASGAPSAGVEAAPSFDYSELPSGDFDSALLESHAAAPVPAVGRAVIGDPGIDAMKDILLKLQTVGETAGERLAEAAAHDSELKAALVTTKTDRGAKIGDWEIIVKEGKGLTTYDVMNEDGVTVIAKDLYVYDAAYGIAKRLNEGVAINDKKIRQLLDLEEDYAKNRNDAAQFKHSAKKLREKGEHMRADVAEDRLDEAQRQAMDAHERMLKLAGLR